MKRFCITLSAVLLLVTVVSAMHPAKAKADMFKMGITEEHSFYRYYENLLEENDNILLTSDFLLYNEHLLLDYSLRYAEEEYISKLLKELLDMLIPSLEEDYKYLKAKKAASARDLALSYLYVSRYLLDEDIKLPEKLKSNILSECSKIEKSSGIEKSALFSKKEDFTQYIPRGHYNDSDKLKKYFRAMMYLQRMGFNANAPDDDPYSELRASIILGDALVRMNKKSTVYERITDMISILLQQQDDLGIEQARKLWNHDLTEKELLNESYLKEYSKKIKEASDSKILSDLLADTDEKPVYINLMGQRYIFDSELFCNLVYNKVLEYSGGNSKAFTLNSGIRHLPRGLDLMYTLGSTDAYLIMEKDGDVQYRNYSDNVKRMKQLFEDMDKGSGFYNRMLLQYMSVLKGRNDNLPVFMADPLWKRKELNTLLSSWASLRHDVILYAKQSYTVKVTSAMPKDVQESKRIIAEPYTSLYSMMIKDAEYLGASLSEKTGDALFMNAASEFKTLAGIYKDASALTQKGQYYENYTALSSAIKNAEFSFRKLLKNKQEKEDNTITVADVHTDVNSSLVLEEASGPVAKVEVTYMNKNFTGGALTYFEFKHPMSDRLTDEKWKSIVAEGGLKEILFPWQKELFR